MSYQFIHIESYSRTGTSREIHKSNGTVVKVEKWSAAQVGAEACRLEGQCPHVENPKEPGQLYGVSPLEAVKLAEEWAEQKKDPKGRKYRSDGLCLLAGVISVPQERANDWDTLKGEYVEFLKEKYGPRLKSVIEHLDEECPHLHFYAVPEPTENFDDIHDGRKAAAAVGFKAKTCLRNQAFKTAMRSFQVTFYEKVAKAQGFLRFGPKRVRLTRAQWVAQKEQAADLSGREKAVSYQRKVVLSMKKEIPKKVEEQVREGLEKAKAALPKPKPPTFLDKVFHPNLKKEVEEQRKRGDRYKRKYLAEHEIVKAKEADLELWRADAVHERKHKETHDFSNIPKKPEPEHRLKREQKATKRSGSSYTP